jgi:hypothetical protein
MVVHDYAIVFAAMPSAAIVARGPSFVLLASGASTG